MRLLSFLSDIEQALIAESPVVEGGAWETTRIVNFHRGLARLTLTARDGAAVSCPGGSIFLQAFVLADGSFTLKASLNWRGSDALPVLSVYATPMLNWKLEASRIAMTWLEGPAETSATASELQNEQLEPLAAIAG